MVSAEDQSEILSGWVLSVFGRQAGRQALEQGASAKMSLGMRLLDTAGASV